MVDRELLREFIRRSFVDWRGPARGEEEPDTLRLHELLGLIRAHGTELEHVGADTVRKVRREQVRDELLEMPEVRVRDANTPEERFTWLRRRGAVKEPARGGPTS